MAHEKVLVWENNMQIGHGDLTFRITVSAKIIVINRMVSHADFHTVVIYVVDRVIVLFSAI